MEMPDEPVVTKHEADLMVGLGELKTELRLIREQSKEQSDAMAETLRVLTSAVAQHGEWIAGHIKECEAQEKRLTDVEESVEEHNRAITEVKGGWKLATFVGILCSGLTALFYHLTHIGKP